MMVIKMDKTKILHVFNIMNMGGAENFIMNVYRNINREKYTFYFLCTSKQKGLFDDEIVDLGGKILHFNNFSSKRPHKVMKEFANVLKENNIDIVHLPIHFFSGYLALTAKKVGIKNIIVHSHSASDSNSNIMKKIYWVFMRFLINKYATKKIACGKDAGKYLFGNLNNVEIIYNGINLDKFKQVNKLETKNLQKKLNIKKDDVVIGNIGRFVPLKNQI